MLNKSLFLLNLLLGTVLLTVLFTSVLSMPVEKSLITAIVLSAILDTAYILERRFRKTKTERKAKTELTTGDKVTLALLIPAGLLLALGIHHILITPLPESFAIAAIVIFLVSLFYVKYFRKFWERWLKQRQISYSTRHLFLETLVALMIFLSAYLPGAGLMESLAMGLFFFILTQWYFSFLSHKYVFSRKFVSLRLSLVFLAMLTGWMYLVKTPPIISLLIALAFTFMVEIDRKVGKRLDKMKGEEELKRAEKRCGVMFQALGIGYGVMIGVMVANKIYGLEYFVEWSLVMYRLGYIFAVMFMPLLVLPEFVFYLYKTKKAKKECMIGGVER